MTRQEILAIAKPILFNTPMVGALLEGRKTVTRRVMKPQPTLTTGGMWHWKDCQWMDGGIGFPRSGIADHAPYHPGDYLYVRETWRSCISGEFNYKADPPPQDKQINPDAKWRPSIHMPKEAARLFLRVTDVRVERLQDAKFSDFLDEGASLLPEAYNDPDNAYLQAQHQFFAIWNSTIKKPDLPLHGCNANPWVWVIEFERVEVSE